MIRYCIRGHITTAHQVARYAACFACGSRSAELLPDDASLPTQLEKVARMRDDTAREWELRRESERDPRGVEVYSQLAKRARAEGHELRATADAMRKQGRGREERAGGQSR